MVAEPMRRRSVDLAALVAHLAAKVTDGTALPARRRRNGHSPDCPHWGRPVDTCGVCRAEVIGRSDGDGDEPDDR